MGLSDFLASFIIGFCP